MALLAATAQILRDAGIADGKVYPRRIPAAEVQNMPQSLVVVRNAGGSNVLTGHWMRVGDVRIDVKCYGATSWSAGKLEEDASAVLHGWTVGNVTYIEEGEEVSVRVGWFTQSGGPNDLVDPDTDWDYSLSTFQAFGQRY